MKASVLIPAFNAESFIRETLVSCINQGFEFIYEVIIIDDHSTDETVQVVNQCIREFQEVKILLSTNPSKGACAARNHAFSISGGEAIQWLDADDLLGSGKLQAQLALLQDHPNHLIASKWRRFAGSIDNLWPEEQGNWAEVPKNSSPREWLLSERMTCCHSWLGTRELFQCIQPWDESLLLNQDGEYFTRAIAASAGVLFEPNSRVYYRSSMPESVSQFRPDKASSLFRAAESFEKTVLTLGDDNALKTLISNHYQGFIYRVYPWVPELRKRARTKIQQHGKPTRAHDVAESRFAKLVCWFFGWRFLILLRLIKSRLFQ